MIFFLSVLLLVPTGARACWDEDWDDYEDTGSWDDDWNDLFDDLDEWIGDDNYYDDSDFDMPDNDYDYTDDAFIYDDDDGSDGFGIGVVGHQPDDDAVNNDWWINQYPDNDDYEEDEDIQGWGDDEGDDNYSGTHDDSDNTDTDAHQKTAAQITNAAKNAVAEMIAKHDMDEAVCNYGVNAVFKSLFGSNELDGKKANDMVRYWQNNPSHWEQISVSQAQQLANEGYFVVAGWINPNSGRSGHVVVVVPGEESYSGMWGCDVPTVMDTGLNKRTSGTSIAYSFDKRKISGVKFFKYK